MLRSTTVLAAIPTRRRSRRSLVHLLHIATSSFFIYNPAKGLYGGCLAVAAHVDDARLAD